MLQKKSRKEAVKKLIKNNPTMAAKFRELNDT